jgi:hypothetical protein
MSFIVCKRFLSSLQSNTLSRIDLVNPIDTCNINLLITQLNHLINYNNKILDIKIEDLHTRIERIEKVNKIEKFDRIEKSDIEDYELLMALKHAHKN